jgi:hypothetical protein
MPRLGWSVRLTRSIQVKDGPTLRTLNDAREYMLDHFPRRTKRGRPGRRQPSCCSLRLTAWTTSGQRQGRSSLRYSYRPSGRCQRTEGSRGTLRVHAVAGRRGLLRRVGGFVGGGHALLAPDVAYGRIDVLGRHVPYRQTAADNYRLSPNRLDCDASLATTSVIALAMSVAGFTFQAPAKRSLSTPA